MSDHDDAAFPCWAILELMGHRRLYGPAAIYCITPTSEEMAGKVAALGRPEPVTQWELSPPAKPPYVHHTDEDEGSAAVWS